MVPRDRDGSDQTDDHASDALEEDFEEENDGDDVDAEESDETEEDASAQELRYEGPITFDDEYEDEYEDEPKGHRFFVTAAILGGAVTIIFALAMILRPDPAGTIETESTPASLAAVTRSGPPDPAPPTTGSDTREGEAMAAADLGTEDATSHYDYREIPDRPPAEPEVEAMPLERPAPVPASRTTRRQASASASAPEATASWTQMKQMIDEGRMSDAAIVGGLYLKNRRPSKWTLQVLFACSSATVKRAFEKESHPDLIVSAARLKGRSCYRLTWGNYATRSEAISGISSVPAYFTREGEPRPLATHTID